MSYEEGDCDPATQAPQREMPKYKSHKLVWALKIAAIEADAVKAAATNCETTGGTWLTPAEEGYSPVHVSREFMAKHKPVVGGYYVVYSDGYTSFSPAKAFEEGYTRV